MAKNWNWWSRKLHRWGALLTSLPMLLVIVTGLLLQVKKQVPWVQPATMAGIEKNSLPIQSWNDLLSIASSVDEAQVHGWQDIERLDIRPSKGAAKIQSVNHWELQVDLANGKILSSTWRRSDGIESLHDGSFFSDTAKLWIFLPNGLVLLGLLITGAWLWYLPVGSRRRRSKA